MENEVKKYCGLRSLLTGATLSVAALFSSGCDAIGVYTTNPYGYPGYYEDTIIIPPPIYVQPPMMHRSPRVIIPPRVIPPRNPREHFNNPPYQRPPQSPPQRQPQRTPNRSRK